jgi:hypothetical protein
MHAADVPPLLPMWHGAPSEVGVVRFPPHSTSARAATAAAASSSSFPATIPLVATFQPDGLLMFLVWLAAKRWQAVTESLGECDSLPTATRPSDRLPANMRQLRTEEKEKRILLFADMDMPKQSARDLSKDFFNAVLLHDLFVPRFYARYSCYQTVLLEGGWQWFPLAADLRTHSRRALSVNDPKPSPFRTSLAPPPKKRQQEEDEEYVPGMAAAAASSSSSPSRTLAASGPVETVVKRRSVGQEEAETASAHKFVEWRSCQQFRARLALQGKASAEMPSPTESLSDMHISRLRAWEDHFMQRNSPYWRAVRAYNMKVAMEELKLTEEQINARFNPAKCVPPKDIRVTETAKNNDIYRQFAGHVQKGLRAGIAFTYTRGAVLHGEPGAGKTHSPQM